MKNKVFIYALISILFVSCKDYFMEIESDEVTTRANYTPYISGPTR